MIFIKTITVVKLERRYYNMKYSGRVESMRLTYVETEDLLPKVVG